MFFLEVNESFSSFGILRNIVIFVDWCYFLVFSLERCYFGRRIKNERIKIKILFS